MNWLLLAGAITTWQVGPGIHDAVYNPPYQDITGDGKPDILRVVNKTTQPARWELIDLESGAPHHSAEMGTYRPGTIIQVHQVYLDLDLDGRYDSVYGWIIQPFVGDRVAGSIMIRWEE